MLRRVAILIIALALASCSDQQAKHHTLFGIVRPDENGRWFIMVDDTHTPYGIDTKVEQTSEYVRIFTCCVAELPVFSKAGSLQITSDDGFNVRVSAHANLGLNNATLFIYVDGELIDPADIWEKLNKKPGNGNLWLTLHMVE